MTRPLKVVWILKVLRMEFGAGFHGHMVMEELRERERERKFVFFLCVILVWRYIDERLRFKYMN